MMPHVSKPAGRAYAATPARSSGIGCRSAPGPACKWIRLFYLIDHKELKNQRVTPLASLDA